MTVRNNPNLINDNYNSLKLNSCSFKFILTSDNKYQVLNKTSRNSGKCWSFFEMRQCLCLWTLNWIWCGLPYQTQKFFMLKPGTLLSTVLLLWKFSFPAGSTKLSHTNQFIGLHDSPDFPFPQTFGSLLVNTIVIINIWTIMLLAIKKKKEYFQNSRKRVKRWDR